MDKLQSQMRFITTFLFLSISIASLSQATISGFIVDSTTKEPIAGVSVTLLALKSIETRQIKESRNYLGRDTIISFQDTSWRRIDVVYTDTSGYYEFKMVNPDFYNISCFIKTGERYGRIVGENGRSGLLHVAGSKELHQDFKLGVFCQYEKTGNLNHCPKCGKAEGVRKQVYGLPSPGVGLEDDGEYYYNGYCVVSNCQPTKICLLCQKEF